MSPRCQDAGPGNRFSKDKRLLTAQHYTGVFNAPDARASSRHLLILAKYNQEPSHRLGLVIAKKNVRLAVQRNRIKRLIRESFRQLEALATDESGPATNMHSMDMIVMARRGIGELDNAQVSSILQQQWKKLFHEATADSSLT